MTSPRSCVLCGADYEQPEDHTAGRQLCGRCLAANPCIECHPELTPDGIQSDERVDAGHYGVRFGDRHPARVEITCDGETVDQQHLFEWRDGSDGWVASFLTGADGGVVGHWPPGGGDFHIYRVAQRGRVETVWPLAGETCCPACGCEVVSTGQGDDLCGNCLRLERCCGENCRPKSDFFERLGPNHLKGHDGGPLGPESEWDVTIDDPPLGMPLFGEHEIVEAMVGDYGWVVFRVRGEGRTWARHHVGEPDAHVFLGVRYGKVTAERVGESVEVSA